jgi:chromosome segregation ATPase
MPKKSPSKKLTNDMDANHVTRADLRLFATKDDMSQGFSRMEKRIDGLSSAMAEFADATSKAFTKAEKRMDGLDDRLEKVEERIGTFDDRFDQIDKRFDEVDRRFKEVDLKFDGVNKRLDDVNLKFDGVTGRIRGLWNAFDAQALNSVKRDEHDRLEKRVKVLETA